MQGSELAGGAGRPPAVRVMTLNVRRRMPRLWPSRSADRWTNRRPLLEALLQHERPGILGIQEALPDQVAAIDSMLGAGYETTGGGRGRRGDGEQCALFVDASRFAVLDSSTWWLSATPTRPGSRSFGNAIPRIVTQAVLSDRAAGSTLTVFVTHFDHLSARSRVESARLLADQVAAVGGATVAMGDFNADAGTAPYRALLDGSGLVDTFDAAEQRIGEVEGTYSRYGSPKVDGRRLDWLLVDTSAIVERAGVTTSRPGGRAVSDHDPVQADVRWGAR